MSALMNTRHILPIIIFSQFCGTSLWFAGNAVISNWQQQYHWPLSSIGHITISVQVGFITGTLLFSLLTIADRFSPSRIFFWCCTTGALFNVLVLVDPSSYALVMSTRYLTGFCLAGIYPVGMKIASDWQEKGLGNWLGGLVGALVLGTALPHGLKLVPGFTYTHELIVGVSAFAALGGIAILLCVPDGPFRKKGMRFSLSAARAVFRITSFKKAAFGYFGHMWELYAFWAFVPWAISNFRNRQPELAINNSLLTFLIIASGAVGCIAGGKLSRYLGSERVAWYALMISGICCVLSPFMWTSPSYVYMTFMFIWGLSVVSDSPQFSTLVARHAPDQLRGSALTIVTCIGFSITIVSIQFLNEVATAYPDYVFLFLAPGPLFGLLSMKRLR